MKHPCIYKDENISLYLEICPDGTPFLHCIVKNWSHNLYKDFKKTYSNLWNILKNKGYKNLYAPEMDNKLYKFARLFGFERTPFYTVGEDGIQRRILKCHQQ